MNRTDEADRLLRILVRQRRSCERCGQPGTDTAHIVRRRFAATRCLETNVWLLDRDCHRIVDNDRTQFLILVHSTIGARHYEVLRQVAEAGPPMPLSAWWPAEHARLRARLRELGLSPRGAAA